MITSIKIDSTDLNTGVVKLSGDGLNISADRSSIVLSKSRSSYTDMPKAYRDYIDQMVDPPVVTKIAGVQGDDNNNVWLLGGISSEFEKEESAYFVPNTADTSTGIISFTDVAQTVNYPRIYRSVFDMLNQIRLWIDSHKDGLLSLDSEAEGMWEEMKTFSEKYGCAFIDPRDREDISDVFPSGFRLVSDYLAVVALWNHIVGIPDSTISIRLHPADSAGIYIGVNISVPILDNTKQTDITIEISVSFSGQGNGNYIPEDVIGSDSDLASLPTLPISMWYRVPVAQAFPKDGVSVGGGSKASADFDTNSGGGIEIEYDAPITKTITASIYPKSRSHYTIQAVMEVIPFFKCSEDAEMSYKGSKQADHFVSIGYNEWSVDVKVSRGEEVIQKLNATKTTPHASVCHNQYSDIDEDSDADETED